MENQALKIVYTFFVAVMLVLFVGLGVDAFYPEPAYPQYPVGEPTTQDLQAYTDALNAYRGDIEMYNRNVSIIATASAVTMLGLSLLLERKNKVLTNGVMLGGLFTLVYGVGRGFVSGDTTMTFIVVSAGLIAVLFLGYWRFSRRGERGVMP
jgi:hypothetical protein